MNNQEFLDELGRRARDVTEQAGQWGASLVALIEQELQEGNEMALGPIGILEVRKEAEYIALHPVTGQRMLVPPRLVVHFRPETGSQQVLAQRFAVRQDIPQELADGFVRQFICLVEDGLQADQYVRVKGLGTFKRMSAGREWKVIFQPDTALSEAVNKPFSHFETVMLKDSTHYSDLKFTSTIFRVGEVASTIEGVTVNDEALQIIPGSGMLQLSGNGQQVGVWSTDGKLLWKGNVGNEGHTISLPAGVYIVNGKKVAL